MPDHDCEYKQEAAVLKQQVAALEAENAALLRKLNQWRAAAPTHAWMPGVREEIIINAWQEGLNLV